MAKSIRAISPPQAQSPPPEAGPQASFITADFSGVGVGVGVGVTVFIDIDDVLPPPPLFAFVASFS